MIAKRRRSGRMLVRGIGGAGLVVGAWLGGLIWFTGLIPEPGPADPSPTDAIIVLTGGSGRIGVGLEQLALGRARKLFISGVYQGLDVAALLRLSTQDPERVRCCVALGYGADNTAGNAREVTAWLTAEGFGSARLVTSGYHMPRSLLEIRRLMPGLALVAHPVFPEHVKQEQWWRWPGTAALIISEYNKYVLAWLRHALPSAMRATPAASS